MNYIGRYNATSYGNADTKCSSNTPCCPVDLGGGCACARIGSTGRRRPSRRLREEKLCSSVAAADDGGDLGERDRWLRRRRRAPRKGGREGAEATASVKSPLSCREALSRGTPPTTTTKTLRKSFCVQRRTPSRVICGYSFGKTDSIKNEQTLSFLRTKICARRPSVRPSATASLIERLIDARTTRNLVGWRRTSYAAGSSDDVRSRQRWIVPPDSRLDYEVSLHLRLFYPATYFFYGFFGPYGIRTLL